MITKSVIHSVFEQVAAQQAQCQAIRAADGEITYEALNEAANRLAFHLRSHHGVERGAVVGLYLPAGIDYVIGLLGVAKAGGVFLPLDPDTPPLRHQQFLAKARPALVISDAQHSAAWAAAWASAWPELNVETPLL